MRGVVGVVAALGMLGCSVSPGPVPDAGVSDATDAAPIDGDVGFVDAFDWPDTGPPLPPVVPAQSWRITSVVGVDTLIVTIDIDARAESGIVRAVGGGGGRAASVIFDIEPDGVLRARGPIPIGILGSYACSFDTVSIDQWVLSFGDTDGDGIRETLTNAISGSTVTRSGPGVSTSTDTEFVSIQSLRPDTDAPMIGLGADPIAGFDPIVVWASEPIDPSFMPRLVGTRSFLLEAELGASAPARWELDTIDLPAGHYELMLGTAHDLTGRAPTGASPTFVMDVPSSGLPMVDGLDAAVTSVRSVGPVQILGDDPGELPIEGATSLLLEGRSVIGFQSFAGHRQLQMLVRFEGPVLGSGLNAYALIYDDMGALVGQTSIFAFLSPPAMVAGFEASSGTAMQTAVAYSATRAGRYFMVLEPGGPSDPACTGTPAVAGVGVTLDAIVPL